DPSTGKLQYIASGPLADSLAYIAVDRTGRFLLGASYPGHRVTVNPIGAPGKVLPPQQVLENYPNAHSIFADAANRFVLVPTLGNDRINQFAFDATTGKLTPTASPAAEARPKAGPRHFVYHPGGKLVYVIGELDGNVPPEKQPRGFGIDPAGRYLLAVGQLSHGLSSYSIDPTSGKLMKLKEYPMGKNPNWVEILDLP